MDLRVQDCDGSGQNAVPAGGDGDRRPMVVVRVVKEQGSRLDAVPADVADGERAAAPDVQFAGGLDSVERCRSGIRSVNQIGSDKLKGQRIVPRREIIVNQAIAPVCLGQRGIVQGQGVGVGVKADGAAVAENVGHVVAGDLRVADIKIVRYRLRACRERYPGEAPGCQEQRQQEA